MRVALFRRTAADPSHFDIIHAERSFRVSIRRRPAARRITLRVSSTTGEVMLTLPTSTDLVTAEQFAAAHGGWIAARIARVPARIAFTPGAQAPFRGVPHRIVHWSNVSGPTLATEGSGGEPVIAVSGQVLHVGRRVRDFLEREAKRDLAEAVRCHTGSLGIQARRVTVRDTKSRWGSCSAQGCLSFSWRLVLAPPFVLDYLAAHEVAHLKEMNHSQRFWRVVHSLCSRTEEAERWLKRHGAELHRFG